mgnify:CR=1 FL=1
MYKYFMKKSNLILTLFISSLFISTSLDAAVFDLNILKNNQKRDLLIASPGGHGGGGGGGGGGGKKPKDKKEECIKRSKRAIGFFERQLFDEERLGKSTEKTLKKIKEYKQLLSKCEDTKTPSERQKEAQEIRKRQKVINEKGYRERWAELRENFLKEKNKINNDPIGDGDFFKLLDEKMAKLKFIEIMLNLIDECQLYQATDLAQENGMPESLRKARTSFINEIKKVYSLFSEEFQNEISNLDFVVSFGFAILKDDR